MKQLLLVIALLATTGVKAQDCNFENGMEGWTVIDANNDGWTWTLTSNIPNAWPYYANMTLDWYQTGQNAICSGSYINGVGALIPNEYLISPLFTPQAGCYISFWAAASDANYPSEHFGVCATTGDPHPANFTMLQEWTMTGAREFTGGRQGAPRRIGNWHNYKVDLSSYAGRPIYVAIRHFNCYDQYVLIVDNIELRNIIPGGGDDGKTVGIEEVDVNGNGNVDGNGNDNYFDLSGRRLQGKPTRQGLYIRQSADGRSQGKVGKKVYGVPSR